ncbi:hypothetical protein, partial [Intestinimonas butyriciproducens]|uniref:hypothetical protein n=1 Tax=Intestinimonas butyriciproducens TaxID=1297617 RepID=UPI001957AB8D
VCAVGRPHSYYSKGSFYFAIIDISLFLNHSPSEWFSEHKKTPAAWMKQPGLFSFSWRAD